MTYADRLEQLIGCPPTPFRRRCREGDKTYTCQDCWENFLSEEFGKEEVRSSETD